MEVDSSVLAEMHTQLVSDLENSDDSASDEEEDAFNWEWEAVSWDMKTRIYTCIVNSYFANISQSYFLGA